MSDRWLGSRGEVRVKKSLNTVYSFRIQGTMNKIIFPVDKKNMAASNLDKKQQQTGEIL